jgi:hypothetical protein
LFGVKNAEKWRVPALFAVGPTQKSTQSIIERLGKMKKVKFTYDEIQALMIVLTEFRNMLMEEDRSTDIIDDIMMKLM